MQSTLYSNCAYVYYYNYHDITSSIAGRYIYLPKRFSIWIFFSALIRSIGKVGIIIYQVQGRNHYLFEDSDQHTSVALKCRHFFITRIRYYSYLGNIDTSVVLVRMWNRGFDRTGPWVSSITILG